MMSTMMSTTTSSPPNTMFAYIFIWVIAFPYAVISPNTTHSQFAAHLPQNEIQASKDKSIQHPATNTSPLQTTPNPAVAVTHTTPPTFITSSTQLVTQPPAPQSPAPQSPTPQSPTLQDVTAAAIKIPQGEVETQRPTHAGTSAQNQPSHQEMNTESEEATRRGLRYLASIQNDDGSFGRGRFARHVGITALCGLAFMADGSVPGRGPYGDVVRKSLEFVLKNATETGLLAAENSHGPMYGHGFATLFLGEVYGMTPEDGRVRDALVRAVELIVNSQNEEGGWRYNPVPYDADVSVTICEIMGLRSARNAGVKVPKETIDRAIAYVRGCQNGDGGFRYMSTTGTSAWPRTAAGVASLFYAGIYSDDSIDRGLGYLQINAIPNGAGPNSEPHYFYGHYYAVQSMYLAGGAWWNDWWPRIRDELVEKQNDQGAWVDYQAGPAYSTAMSLIILQMPKRYLPIFQK